MSHSRDNLRSFMRRWLTVLLLVFLPLQFTWAAVGAYCKHEAGAAANHVGHHDHQHEAADEGALSGALGAGDIDPDCGVCYAGCATVLAGMASLHPASASTAGMNDPRFSPPLPLVERPERPNWLDLA